MSPDNTAAEPRRIVVRIDGETLPDEAIAREFALLLERYAERAPPSEIEAIADRILDDAIENAIERHLLLRAARAEIGPPAAEMVDSTVVQWQRRRAEQDEAVAPISEEDLRRVRQHIADEITLSRYYDRVCADVPRPSTDDCRQWYAEHPESYRAPERVRLLLITRRARPGESVLAANAALLNARERLRRGDPFLDVARDVSDAPNDADVGWVDESMTGPDLWREIAGLSAGETSDVFAIGLTRHLARVEEREAASLKPFSEVWRSIEDELFTERKNRRIGEVVDTIRPSAKIEIERPPRTGAPADGGPAPAAAETAAGTGRVAGGPSA